MRREFGRCLELANAVHVAPGDPVVLYDEAGSVIAQGTLGRARSETSNREASDAVQVCALRFSVDDIRRTEAVTVEIGSAWRATYRTDELDARSWYLEIPLGS